jgi:hypothetical protein
MHLRVYSNLKDSKNGWSSSSGGVADSAVAMKDIMDIYVGRRHCRLVIGGGGSGHESTGASTR